MGVDFDLSIFRLVKSFAAVEISKNVGTSGSADASGTSDTTGTSGPGGELPADPVQQGGGAAAVSSGVRPAATPVPSPRVQPGLAAAIDSQEPAAVDRIPERLDSTMRASLDQRLEGAEREAVNWQHGARSAALSLAGLARPSNSLERRLVQTESSDTARLPEQDAGNAASATGSTATTARQALKAAQVLASITAADVATAEQDPQPDASILTPQPRGTTAQSSSTVSTATAATAAQPDTVPSNQRAGAAAPAVALAAGPQSVSSQDGEPFANIGATPGRPDVRPAGTGPDKQPLLPASTIALIGEWQTAEVLQSMAELRRLDRPAPLPTSLKTAEAIEDPSQPLDETPADRVTTRDTMRLSHSAITSNALANEQAELSDRRSREEPPLENRQRTGTGAPALSAKASLPLDVSTQPGEAQDILSRALMEAQGSDAVSRVGAETSSLEGAAAAADAGAAEMAASSAGAKAVPVIANAKMLELLDALVALSPSADDGSADWQSLSAVILNAAMIPGWPPARPIENPASAKQVDPLAQLAQAEPEDAPAMTPEQLLAYLMSIGANLRLLRALQELVSRIEKKDGPALLAWLAGLVSALKVIEKSLKDIVEDGMELPEWLAEILEAAKRPRKRKQFHI